MPARPDGNRACPLPVRRAARRPQARADRGGVELGPPCLRRRSGRRRRDLVRAPAGPAGDRGDRRGRWLRSGRGQRRTGGALRRRARDRDHPRGRRRGRDRQATGRKRIPPSFRESSELAPVGLYAARPFAVRERLDHAPTRQRRTQVARGLRDHRDARADGRDPPSGRAPRRQACRARVGNRLRRRRRGDQLHARPADAGSRPRGRVADHPRRGRVLQRHEDHPQRAPGQSAGARRRAARDLHALPAAERAGVRGRLRLRRRPRSAAGRADRLLPAVRGALDLARPHRLLDAEPGGLRLRAAVDPALRRRHLPHARVRAAGRRPAALLHLAPRDRPAGAEEHGPVARGRGVHRRPVRHRRRTTAAHAGVAVRPVEGSARRDRRVPRRQGTLPRRATRARRLDGA